MGTVNYDAEKKKLKLSENPHWAARPKAKRWGTRAVKGREGIAALAVEGAVAYYLVNQFLGKTLEDLKESAYMVRHAGKTIADAVQGGPEGNRKMEDVDAALDVLIRDASGNKEAEIVLKQHVESLLAVYNKYETISRVASRLKVQIKGAAKYFYEVGNDLKPGFVDTLDNMIIDLYGKDPKEAREKSEFLKKFYKDAREFYDAVEDREDLVASVGDIELKAIKEKQKVEEVLNKHFPGLITHLQNGYDLESYIIAMDTKGADITGKEVEGVGARVKEYDHQLRDARTEISSDVKLPDYSTTNLADYMINPLTFAVVGLLAYRGATGLVPALRKGLNMMFAAPVKWAGDGAAYMKDYISSRMDARSEDDNVGKDKDAGGK